jgi:phytoene synthase
MGLPLRSSFAPAFWLLPEPRRSALVALHRFCRAADESVDGIPAASPDASARLDVWRREVAALFGQGAVSTPEGRALAPFVARYGMKHADFDRLMEGLARDARGEVLETEEDLARYCLGVAAAPGFLSLSIFGCPEARAYAHRLGLALQMTNILRDAREDLASGRLYFPLEDLRAAGLTAEELATFARSGGAEPESVRRLIERGRERARAWFAEAESAYEAEPATTRRFLGAARGMHYLYRELLSRLEKESPLPRRRVRPSRTHVLSAVFRAWRDTALAG